MRTTSVDASELEGPLWAVDGFTSALNVIVGQVYIMYIDNFDNTGQAFDLSWSLTNGASLDCTVLPIGEVILEAHPLRSSVEVEWSTSFERGSSHFIVERSTNALDFQVVGSVPARGDSEAPSTYRFLDTKASLGLNYYRIQSIGSDGSIQYSPVASALLTNGSNATLAPNPVNEGATLFLHAAASGSMLLRTMDTSGRLVHEQIVVMEQGDAQVRVQWPDLDPGAYVLLVLDASDHAIATVPFVRQ
jgi:hypothetical protein